MIPLYFPPINALGNVCFRKLCLNNGADFVFTEMVRVEKLLEGVEYQFNKLKVFDSDLNRTFVQIICSDIKNISKGVEIVMRELPSLKEINYNMGCPRSSRASKEWGAGILSDPSKVFEVCCKLKEACSKFRVIPSVKIRLGIDRDNINVIETVGQIHNSGVRKVYIHGRTLKDGYSGKATYTEIGLVKEKFPDMEVIANGDIIDSESLAKVIDETKCDGVLIGRAALRNPSVFNRLKEGGYFVDGCGNSSDSRMPLMKEFVEICSEEGLSLGKIKAGLVCLSQDVIGGAEFRRGVNDCLSQEDLNSLF